MQDAGDRTQVHLASQAPHSALAATWRELHARGQKLLRLGTPAPQLPEKLGISGERWAEIVAACSQRVVAWEAADPDREP